MLGTVKWGKFNYTKLFKICKIKYKLTKLDLNSDGTIPVYSSESINNGIVGYTKIEAEFIVSDDNPIYIIFGDHTRSFNIATESFCVMDNVKVLSIKKILSVKALLFIISSWKKCIPNLGYSRHWSLAKNILFNLPIDKNQEINFDFINSFIEELEVEHLTKIEEYLKVFNLKDYSLSREEEKIINDFEKGRISFDEFEIGELFEVNSYKKRFDANKVVILDVGKPYVVRTSLNNGIRGYINENEEYLNDGNTISFGQDTATMFYQEKPYFTGDKIKILKSKDNKFNKQNAQFFIASMSKSFSSFRWGNSSFNVKIIENQKIQLPTKDYQPDYKVIEIFISAIKKLVIKDIVLYVDNKFKK